MARTKNLAVVGNGMATCRLLDELVRRGANDRYDITVFGEEAGGSYNRVLLSKVLAGSRPDTIVTKPQGWYQKNRIRLVDGTTVERLDPGRKRMSARSGEELRYDVAVLATGSQPVVPAIPGLTGPTGDLRDGVFVYRTMEDCLKMRKSALPGDSAVVLGGGLLGLEAAKVLADLGLHVTVVHMASSLLNAQVDPFAGEMLRRRIEKLGIFVRMGRTVEAILGESRAEGVILDDGRSLPADMVVLACGVRPRVDLARVSGLPINRGIVVNDVLATEAPGVYALGECAEHAGKTYGVVGPVWEQASVLADVLSGENPHSRYQGSKLYTRLKVAGVEVASMGTPEPERESDSVLQVIEERRDAYRKLIVRDGRLIGATLVGDTEAAATLVQAFDRGDPLPDNPLELLCKSGPCGGAPRDRMICNCHKVTDATIRLAVSGGARSVEAVGAATLAGTGCGSCRTDIARLVGQAPAVPVPVTAKAS
jgi:nitrite reductase (NADH) large subunit